MALRLGGIHQLFKSGASESNAEVSKALLETQYSETDSESVDSLLQAEIIERPVRRWSFWLIAILVLLNFVGFLALYLLIDNVHCFPQPLLTPSTRLFPLREYETVVFHDENLRPGPDQDAEWEADLPKGHGFIIIDDPNHLGLPTGMPGGGALKRYGVTWAHQYHCIWMLREEFWKFVDGNSTLIGKSLDQNDEDSEYMWHLAHCFGFLKQTIICNMDMTIEYPTLGGPNQGTINGYEIPHQCAKRSVFDRYMSEHAPEVELRASDIVGEAKHMHGKGG